MLHSFKKQNKTLLPPPLSLSLSGSLSLRRCRRRRRLILLVLLPLSATPMASAGKNNSINAKLVSSLPFSSSSCSNFRSR